MCHYKMRRAFLIQFVVLFPALVLFVNAEENYDLKALEYANRMKESLSILFPVNIVKQLSYNTRNDGLNRVGGTKCDEQVTLLQEGIMNNSMWALQMIDSSSKIPSGIFMGNNVDLGMFDECVEINAYEAGEEIRGRHCMYKVLLSIGNFTLTETLSICLPSSCEPEDVERLVKSALELVQGLVGVDLPISIIGGAATCTSVDPPEWTAGGIVTLVGFSLLLLFLVISTITDIFARYSSKKPQPNGRLDMLRQFSLYSSAVRVLNTKTSPQTLPALQGLRFFSMCWVIIGHTYMMTFFNPTVNLTSMLKWIPTWDSLYIMTATFSVDSFFAISGFLMTYVFLKEMSTGRSFNIFSYYLHRYLRLTPAFAATILITIFISPRLGSGPLWEQNSNLEEQACREGWWTKLLYLHNYINIKSMSCMGHTWYLAVDMQFFWISPLILYPLAKKPKIGLAILAAFFVASIVTPVKIGYDNEYSTTMISNRLTDRRDNQQEKFYIPSHVRAAPWLIGIFFGYLLFVQKGSTMSKAITWIGWLLATAAFAFCIFTMRIFEGKDYKYDIVWESIYTGVARPFWGFAVSWLMYACIRGSGGPVSTFLSFPIYTPLSRISYCIYLVHYQIQFMKGRASRTSDYFSPLNSFNRFLTDLMLSIMVGFVFTLLFESPILVLEKMVKKRRGRAADDTQKILEETVVEKGIDNSGLKSN